MHPTNDRQLLSTSGTYYVMSELSFRGLHASCTFGNAPSVDILVANIEGTQTLAIQVKTTAVALRTRGRGANKKAYELQWDLGHNAGKISDSKYFFAFVDLTGSGRGNRPDVYIVPSVFVHERVKDWVGKCPRLRFHIRVDEMIPFKNNWDELLRVLENKGNAAVRSNA